MKKENSNNEINTEVVNNEAKENKGKKGISIKNINKKRIGEIGAIAIMVGVVVGTVMCCTSTEKESKNASKPNKKMEASSNNKPLANNTKKEESVVVNNTNREETNFTKTETKEEVSEVVNEVVEKETKEESEEIINIEEIRNDAKVSYEEYEKAYLNFYQKYGESLSFNSIDSIVYYMNYNNVTSDTLNQIVDKYIANDSSVIINDTAIALNDIVNYNINAKLASRSKETINLSEAIVDENEKRGIEYIESLIDVIAKGTDDEALSAYRELHSIVVYNDADVSNEIGTDYDKASFNELNAGEQYMVKVAYLPEAAVLAGVRGINEKTYIYDEETNTANVSTITDDLSALASNTVNPLAMDCKKLVLK